VPVVGIPSGWTLATVFVNGIPSGSRILLFNSIPPLAIVLTNELKLPGGSFQFGFTNNPGVAFTALGSTNVALGLSHWTDLGGVSEVSPGQFQFIDLQATNYPRRFYRVRVGN